MIINVASSGMSNFCLSRTSKSQLKRFLRFR